MSDLRTLAARMNRLANDLDVRSSNVAIAVAAAVVTDLIQNTPVDTSKALSNWVVSLGSKSGAVLAPFVPGSAGSSQGASQSQAVAAAVRILTTKTPGQSIWISNNLPYIRRLNDGYSKQAPAGFVERALLVGRYTVKRVKF